MTREDDGVIERLEKTVAELKEMWFDDVNPLETEYADEFREWCAGYGLDPSLRDSDF